MQVVHNVVCASDWLFISFDPTVFSFLRSLHYVPHDVSTPVMQGRHPVQSHKICPYFLYFRPLGSVWNSCNEFFFSFDLFIFLNPSILILFIRRYFGWKTGVLWTWLERWTYDSGNFSLNSIMSKKGSSCSWKKSHGSELSFNWLTFTCARVKSLGRLLIRSLLYGGLKINGFQYARKFGAKNHAEDHPEMFPHVTLNSQEKLFESTFKMPLRIIFLEIYRLFDLLSSSSDLPKCDWAFEIIWFYMSEIALKIFLFVQNCVSGHITQNHYTQRQSAQCQIPNVT